MKGSASNLREVLVLLKRPPAPSDLGELRRRYSVLHQLSDRLILLRLEEDQIEAVREVDSVEDVFEKDVPREILEQMDPNEALFAQAWASRMGEKPKPRKGDKLDWNAKGFEPPDLPEEE